MAVIMFLLTVAIIVLLRRLETQVQTVQTSVDQKLASFETTQKSLQSSQQSVLSAEMKKYLTSLQEVSSKGIGEIQRALSSHDTKSNAATLALSTALAKHMQDVAALIVQAQAAVSNDINRGVKDIGATVSNQTSQLNVHAREMEKSGTRLSNDVAAISVKLDQSSAAILQRVQTAHEASTNSVHNVSRDVHWAVAAEMTRVTADLEQTRKAIHLHSETADYFASLENTAALVEVILKVRSEMDVVSDLLRLTMVNNLINDMNNIVVPSEGAANQNINLDIYASQESRLPVNAQQTLQ